MYFNFYVRMIQGPLYSIDGDGGQTLAGVLQGGWSEGGACGTRGFDTWVEIFSHLEWIKKMIESESLDKY